MRPRLMDITTFLAHHGIAAQRFEHPPVMTVEESERLVPRLPGAKGVGPKTAANLLAQYGTLEAMLEDGRFEAQAEELRMYRRMATLDASAPLPPLTDQTPNWAEASSFIRELGLNALADRVAALGA